MIPYTAPLRDMRFALHEVIGLDRVSAIPAFESATPDLVDAVLEEAGKLASGVLAPLNTVGDKEGAKLANGVVRTATGWKDAYAQYRDGGWNSVPFEPEYGGQGLPFVVATAVQEMWQAANMAFALCPMLNQGAVEALTAHGSDEQKSTYLTKLISGEWTGTMNLTEPSAGSDVGAVRTKAVPDGDRWRITGQKIFITYGEHDMADNIVHLVLARTPNAPAGTKGISLFIVPKFLVNADGSLGERNDLRCVSLEHKMGIHASPTAVMAFGDNGGAIGYLVGEENRGMEYMFTMMNNARLGVGLQGVAIAERAYQQALAYARSRIQSKSMANPAGDSVAIIHHPDVRRMLLTMKAQIEAGRALALYASAALDIGKHHEDPQQRRLGQAMVDLLTPVVKAWCTDMGCEVSSIGVQIHGGMGFIEETGAAQHMRDARIAPIYEGTNGIQANDLAFRKVARDKGEAARTFIAEMRGLDAKLAAAPGDDLAAIRAALSAGIDALDRATDWVVANSRSDAQAVAASAAHYLRLFGIVAGGSMMARAALAAQAGLGRGGDAAFYESKLITCRFYADQILPQAAGLAGVVTDGWRTVNAIAEDQF